jgi:hypothetical protein
LIFEQDGASKFFFGDDLEKVLKFQEENGGNQIDFVVTNSCHSEQCGKVFSFAGIPHVICIKKNKEVRDEASILFSKVFYPAVFNT